MPVLELVVSVEQSGRTVRSLLKYELGLSTARINRLKRTDTGLAANGSRVFTNAVLQAGDRLTVDLNAAEHPTAIPPVPMKLDIVYEDGHLLILNKPAPLAVIPSSLSPGEPTLAGGLASYLGENFSFHPVNRLDRGTTGLMVVAKSGFIHDRLRRALHSSGFFRQYQAVCTGVPQPQSGHGIGLCKRAEDKQPPVLSCKRKQRILFSAPFTDYRVLAAGGGFSLVELTPRTGRTHQLRLHMAALGCPLAGDWLYGTEDPALIARPALHAARLELIHPVTGEPLSFTAPLPEDMTTVLERFVCPS